MADMQHTFSKHNDTSTSLNNDITFSIIVPVYNVVSYLPRLIKQLEVQNLDNTEVLFVNDGSTDGSEQYLASLNNDHFIVLNQKNQGVAGARNRGLSSARGEYICFIDPDDAISAHYVEQLRTTACATQADLLITDWHKIRPDGIEIKSVQSVISGDRITAQQVISTILRTDVILGSLWAKVFKKTLFDNNRCPEQRAAEDFIPCIKAICSSSRIVYVKDVYYEYTSDRPDSLQNNLSAQDIEEAVLVHEQLAAIVEQQFPDLMKLVVHDSMSSRVQACTHICKSPLIANNQRKALFYKYSRGLKKYMSLVWSSSDALKDKVLFTCIVAGYYPCTLALRLRSALGDVKMFVQRNTSKK